MSISCRGDSWRAQVSHIFDLQFNMTCLKMKVDFGGLDRWEYAERLKNMAEAEQLREYSQLSPLT
jgi:hypothetical protein